VSGVGLIAGDTLLGRHMAVRLARALSGTDDPLRSVLVLEPFARPQRRSLPLRMARRLRRLISDRDRLTDLVQRYEREARAVFLDSVGPLPDWPEGCEIRRIPRAEVNAATTVAWQAGFEPAVIVLTGTPIIHAPMLRTASRGVLNLHGSLLPHYRGTRVETWQLLNGDLDKAGLTIHYVEASIDTGDIVAQVPQAAEVSDGPWIMRARNQLHALDAMPKAVCEVLAGTAERRRQDPEAGGRTYRYEDITPEILHEVIAIMKRMPCADPTRGFGPDSVMCRPLARWRSR